MTDHIRRHIDDPTQQHPDQVDVCEQVNQGLKRDLGQEEDDEGECNCPLQDCLPVFR